jgi:CHAT domain-containing protein
MGRGMKGTGNFILALALFIAAWSGAAVPAVRAAEPSEKLKLLQKKAAGLYQAGSYSEALQAARQTLALTIDEFGPASEQASIQAYGVGLTAEAAGDFAEAGRQYSQSVRIREIVYGPGSSGVAAALERLGHALLKLGRLAEAEAAFTRELKIWQDLIGEHAISAGAYSGLGAVTLMRGDFRAALTNYRKAVQQLASQTATQTVARSAIEADIKAHREAFVGLGQAAWGLRQQSGADQAALIEETFAAGQRAWATSAASALAKMTARLKAGETELGRAIRNLETLNRQILVLNRRDMKAIAAWGKVQQADPGYRETLEAFSAASIAQSKETAPAVKRQKELIGRLQDMLKRCPPGVSQSGCEGSESERTAISKELSALSAQAAQGAGQINQLSQRLRAAEQQLPGFDEFDSARAARLAESARLEAELSASRADIVKRFPDYLSLAEPAPLTIEETRKLLGKDEALVAILTGPQSSLVWVVTRDRADWAEISAGEVFLEAEVRALRRGLDPQAEGSPESFDTGRAYHLYNLLLEGFSPLLSGKRHLLLVPTGPLSSLPFQVLVTEPPRGGLTEAEALKQAQWLIRRHALSVLPSVQSLSALRKFAASGVAVKPYFGIGDPMFGNSPPAAGNAQEGGKSERALAAAYRNGPIDVRLLRTLAPLPETAGELRAVARTLGAPEENIIVGAAATKARLKATPLGDYRILHFATHGLVAGDLSGLREPALVLTLPPQSTSADDALLTSSEVATLQLNADWAVLSACNTASANRVGADALSGLARAFFFAGARALLVSHWAVDSQATVDLTTRTFKSLAAVPGLGRAEAFQRAMLSLIEEGHVPGHWAPFIIVGEGGAGHMQGG